MKAVQTYPKMNETIKDLLRRSEEPMHQYILTRIEELEKALLDAETQHRTEYCEEGEYDCAKLGKTRKASKLEGQLRAKRILKRLHEAEGCEVFDEYGKGWDAAIKLAIQAVTDATGVTLEEAIK